MKILFVGEIVGRLGRRAAGRVLPELLKNGGIAAVFANAENLAHGKGATAKTVEEVRGYGVDAFTSGDHIFWREDFYEELNTDDPQVIRPANYPQDVPGKGFKIMDMGTNGKVLLINLLGRDRFSDPVACPFRTADQILAEFSRKEFAAIVVDFHAETTSEKVALQWYLDGRVSAIIGTHTHVPTADAGVMPQGTAVVTDVGMVGAQHSVLGVEPEIIIRRFKNPQLPERFEWTDTGPAVFNSVLIEVDEDGKAKSIKRVDEILAP
jgi:hypothetical protein